MAFTDTMLKSLLNGLGVKPEEIVGALQFLLAEANAIKADRESFKAGVQRFIPGVSQFMQRTDDRFAKLETLMLDIQSRLPPRALEAPDVIEAEPLKLMNGADHG